MRIAQTAVLLQHPRSPVEFDPPTQASIRRALEASNEERQKVNEQIGREVIPLHPLPGSPQQRLDDLRLEERCAVDAIAQSISRSLYGKDYDRLRPANRIRVEGAARRALRTPQGVWIAEATRKAHLALERAMAQEMGPVFQMQAPEARQAQARIGVQAVLSALISVLELQNPFNGDGEALPIYEAAVAAAREVR